MNILIITLPTVGKTHFVKHFSGLTLFDHTFTKEGTLLFDCDLVFSGIPKTCFDVAEAAVLAFMMHETDKDHIVLTHNWGRANSYRKLIGWFDRIIVAVPTYNNLEAMARNQLRSKGKDVKPHHNYSGSANMTVGIRPFSQSIMQDWTKWTGDLIALYLGLAGIDMNKTVLFYCRTFLSAIEGIYESADDAHGYKMAFYVPGVKGFNVLNELYSLLNSSRDKRILDVLDSYWCGETLIPNGDDELTTQTIILSDDDIDDLTNLAIISNINKQ